MNNPQGPDYDSGDTGSPYTHPLIMAVILVGLLIFAVWYLSDHMGSLANTIAPAATLLAKEPSNTATGSLPADICMIDGKPQILHAEAVTASGFDGFSFTYIRTDGYIVAQLWRKSSMQAPYQAYILQADMCRKGGDHDSAR